MTGIKFLKADAAGYENAYELYKDGEQRRVSQLAELYLGGQLFFLLLWHNVAAL